MGKLIARGFRQFYRAKSLICNSRLVTDVCNDVHHWGWDKQLWHRFHCETRAQNIRLNDWNFCFIWKISPKYCYGCKRRAIIKISVYLLDCELRSDMRCSFGNTIARSESSERTVWLSLALSSETKHYHYWKGWQRSERRVSRVLTESNI